MQAQRNHRSRRGFPQFCFSRIIRRKHLVKTSFLIGWINLLVWVTGVDACDITDTPVSPIIKSSDTRHFIKVFFQRAKEGFKHTFPYYSIVPASVFCSDVRIFCQKHYKYFDDNFTSIDRAVSCQHEPLAWSADDHLPKIQKLFIFRKVENLD